jgi:hypothetical protein
MSEQGKSHVDEVDFGHLFDEEDETQVQDIFDFAEPPPIPAAALAVGRRAPRPAVPAETRLSIPITEMLREEMVRPETPPPAWAAEDRTPAPAPRARQVPTVMIAVVVALSIACAVIAVVNAVLP